LIFKDRAEAAALLAGKLKSLAKKNVKEQGEVETPKEKKNVILMGIPRGGVVTADVIASKLERELDIVISTKIPAPFNSELEVGAVMHDGTFLANTRIINMLNVSQNYIDEQISREVKKTEARLLKFRGTKQYLIHDEILILVDDGICTGLSMSVAATWARSQNINKLIIAIPVGPKDTVEKLKQIADIVVVLHMPQYCEAVGEFYQDFPEVTDEQVLQIMKKHRKQ
jgi:putative phosphoribosyl transferase